MKPDSDILGSRDRLIDENREYVHKIAGKLVQRMGLPLNLFDELVAAGYLGLVEAADRFDRDSGKDFRTYAFLRIRGAIIDNIRSHSDLTGETYRMIKAFNAAHELREDDFQSRKESSLSNVLDYVARGALAFRLSMADAETELVEIPDPAANPDAQMERRERAKRLKEIIHELPDRERRVIEGYYFHGLSFIEIAREWEGVGKSWVSKLHTRAIDTIKEKFDAFEAATC